MQDANEKITDKLNVELLDYTKLILDSLEKKDSLTSLEVLTIVELVYLKGFKDGLEKSKQFIKETFENKESN
jgi:hypothetical protein